MGMTVVDKIPAPAQTVSGKTHGPAVALGRCRVGRGMPLFLHVTELRQAVAAFGWPTPEHHTKLSDELAQAKDLLADADAKIDQLTGDLEKARAALTIQFAPAKPAKTVGAK